MKTKIRILILLMLLFSLASAQEIQPVKFLNRMSTNSISAITEDETGFLWLGTDNGIGRFDGYTLEQVFNLDPELFMDQVSFLFKDKQGNILIGTRKGAYCYNKSNSKLFRICPIELQTYTYAIAEDLQGNLWIGTDLGIFILNKSFELVRRLTYSKGLSGNKVNDLRFVSDSLLIIGTEKGVDAISISGFTPQASVSDIKLTIKKIVIEGTVKKFYIDSYGYFWLCLNEEIFRKKNSELLTNKPFEKIAYNIEAACVAQINNQVWIGSRGQSIVRFSLENAKQPQQLETIWMDKSNKSEIKNTVLSIYQDKFSNVWIGSLDGFYVLPKTKDNPFIILKSSTENLNSPSHNTISSIIYDRNNTVWMATANGLSRFDWIDRKKKTYQIKRFTDASTPTNLIRDNKIQNIIECSPDNILLSTKSTIRFFNSKTSHFYSNALLDSQLTKEGIRYIYSSCKDKDGKIWLAAAEGGISFFNCKTKMLTSIRSVGINESRHRSIICDKYGNIWFTSDEQGLFSVKTGLNDKIEKVVNYPVKLFGNAFTTALKEDQLGNIWIGSSNGVFILNTKTGIVKLFENETIKQNFYVKSFAEDVYGNMWVSSLKGVYKISASYEVEYYEPIPNAFISKAQYIFGETLTPDGIIFLGGVNGLTIFDPQEIYLDNFNIKPCISGFSILGKQMMTESNNSMMNINQTSSVILTHNDYHFSVEFSSMQLTDVQTTKYAFRLLGFDSLWTYTDAQHRMASYSNLKPGKYEFQIKATNNSGKWMKSERILYIKVLPAPWKTWWAYTIYTIFLSGLLVLIVRTIIVFNSMKHKEEMTQWKIRYYHNIINTIKTPLSLLQAPLTNIIDNFENLSVDKIKESLYVIQSNSKRLSHFVRQLVEFRKIDIGKANLKLVETDIVQFSKSVFEAFQFLAESKGLICTFESNVNSQFVIVDIEKIEMVLFNLLSNAVKFTNQGGNIKLTCTHDTAEKKIWISISDTGIGIAKENKLRVFERFWTVELANPDSQIRGNGIGLSLVKDFIDLHESKVLLNSTLGEGSEFKFFLSTDEKYLNKLRSVQKINQCEANPVYSTQHIGIIKQASTLSRKSKNTNLPLIYSVDPDENLLQYLKDELSDAFQVEIFTSIPDAKKAIQSKQPNLLISEAMFANLPYGFEFCRQIKSDNYTSHIIILMLSGLSSEEDKLHAYESGVDAFVSKPFEVSYIKVRIYSLLKLQTQMKEKIKQVLLVNPKEVDISSDNDIFLANAMLFIEENLSNPDFGVDQLAERLNITRSMLYRRFKILVDLSPADFIKQTRLKRAALLFESTTYNVSEVADQVGFSDARYLSKMFKDQFGVLPKSYSIGKKKKS